HRRATSQRRSTTAITPAVNDGQWWSTAMVNGGHRLSTVSADDGQRRRTTVANHRSTVIDRQSTGGSTGQVGSGRVRVGSATCSATSVGGTLLLTCQPTWQSHVSRWGRLVDVSSDVVATWQARWC
nr:hypothetical protein [Tanacetum cinerariifolium]